MSDITVTVVGGSGSSVTATSGSSFEVSASTGAAFNVSTGTVVGPLPQLQIEAGAGISIDPSGGVSTISANLSELSIPANLADLSNVNGTPTAGQVLAWNGSSWSPADDQTGGSSDVANLGDLSDVTLGSVTAGQVLAYNGTAWTAAADSALTLSSSAGADLGTAAVGTSGEAARADHIHNLPTFAQITSGTATVTGNLTLDPSTGGVILSGGTAGSGSLTLNCEQNTHGVTIQSPPHSAAATYTLTLPASDGEANQVLQTDGSGNLSWANQSAGGDGITWVTEPAASDSTGSAGQVAYGSGFFYLHDGSQWLRVSMATFGVVATSGILAENGDRLTTEGGDSIGRDGSASTPTIAITTQPQDLTLASGGSGSFTIAATVSDGSTPSYQWQNSDDNGATWDTLAGSTGTAYSLSGVSTLDSGTQYRVVVSAAGASDVTSSVAILTVSETFDILAENGDRLMTEGGDSIDHDGTGGTGGGTSGTAWTQVGADIDGEAAGIWSGYSVAMSGDGSRVAIGATEQEAAGSQAGRVRVFDLIGSAWTQVGSDIDGEAVDDASGWSVALSSDGSRVAIGAPSNDGSAFNTGHVRVYELVGSTWTQVGADIDGEDAYDTSGRSVALSSDGSRVAIGASLNDGSSGGQSLAGHVRVYELVGSTWTQVGADIDGEAADDRSGHSVDLSSDGSRVAIGANKNRGPDGGSADLGHVRVYELVGSTWTQVGADIDGEAAGDWSGTSVSLSSDGSRVAIGAPFNGAGHVRVYDLIGSTWTQVGADIDGEAAGDQSGYSVDLSSDGSRVAIGAPLNGNGGSNYGHVRVYELVGSTWTQVGADIDGEAVGDRSGYSVAMSGDGSRVVIGAFFNDDAGTDAGHVRVYGWG